MASRGDRISRRQFLQAATAVLAAPDVAARAGASADARDAATARVVRVASVTTAVEGGVLPGLVAPFREQTGIDVAISAGNDPYAEAAAGRADLVISHFGHRNAERFVLDRLGLWPRTVFSNQLGLFGPPSDPAKVRALRSLVEAFRRIARANAPYVVNDLHGVRYLTQLVWHAAGRPAKGAWFVDRDVSRGEALQLAAERGGYVMWGLTPFVHEQRSEARRLLPLVTADPMMQRLMVSIVVNPEHVPGADAALASKLQDFLLSPATQAAMLGVHYPGVAEAVWAPAGRHNAGSVLPE